MVDGAFGLHRERGRLQRDLLVTPSAAASACCRTQSRDGCPSCGWAAEVVAIHLGERWLERGTANGCRSTAWWRRSSLPATARPGCSIDLPAEVCRRPAALRWVRVLNLALGVDGAAAPREHWLYFPDPELPFYRVGFPSNHGDLAPPGCHTVSVEVSLDPGCAARSRRRRQRREVALVAAGLARP